MKSIAQKFVNELNASLVEKSVQLELSTDAIAALAILGYDPQNGARPMERIVRERLKKPLSEAILFGDLEHGGRVIVDADGDKFTFEFEPKESESQEPMRRASGNRANPSRWTRNEV